MRAAVKPLSDPIVDEIHAIREAIAKTTNDDLRKIAEAARSRQAASGRKVVGLPPGELHRPQRRLEKDRSPLRKREETPTTVACHPVARAPAGSTSSGPAGLTPGARRVRIHPTNVRTRNG